MEHRAANARACAAMHLPIVYEYDRHAGQPEIYQTPDGCIFGDWEQAVEHCRKWLDTMATYDTRSAVMYVLAHDAEAKKDE